MKDNFEFKQLAKNNLEGKWPIAILVWLIAWLVTDAFTGNGGKEAAEYVWRNGELVRVYNDGFNSAASLIGFIIGGPINFGLAAFFLNLARHQDAGFSDLFKGFKYFGKTFLLNLLLIVFTFLWFILLVVPGIIAILRYSMAFYLINDNPEIGPLEAIERSKEMMKGNKGRLFSLWLSFLGWFILGLLTFGIGFLYAMPYYNAAKANFYEDLKSNSY